ncbi:MAG: hypothetical protein HQL82_17115, partial [Magnetococcales bacterium]|nr:hypothetical protein [Magnetococcales bacterium]
MAKGRSDSGYGRVGAGAVGIVGLLLLTGCVKETGNTLGTLLARGVETNKVVQSQGHLAPGADLAAYRLVAIDPNASWSTRKAMEESLAAGGLLVTDFREAVRRRLQPLLVAICLEAGRSYKDAFGNYTGLVDCRLYDHQ